MADLEEHLRDLHMRVLRARHASLAERKELLFDPVEEVIHGLLDNETLTEEELLLLVQRKDLAVTILQRLGNDSRVEVSYQVKRALLFNVKTPASVGLKFVGQLFTFDIMSLLLIPAIAREVKAAGEEMLCRKLPQLALGERLTLARRTNSDRLLSLLLDDSSREVVGAVLTNAFLREGLICAAIRKPTVKPHTVEQIAINAKWSCRQDVRYTLLRTKYLSLGTALNFLQTLNSNQLRELAGDPSVPAQLRSYIKSNLEKLQAERRQKLR
jgi:hypothetical protein